MKASSESPPDSAAPLADPSLRLLGVVIEISLTCAPLLLLGVLGLNVGSRTIMWIGAGSSAFVLLLLSLLNLVWLHRHGQTVGKRLLGLRIVRANGERAGLVRLVFLRYLLPIAFGFVPWVGGLFGAMDSLMIFTHDRRTIHDQMADTIVIDIRRPAP